MKIKSNSQSFLFIALLILAGEAVFILPFVLPRVFRATVLEVFQITNVEIGIYSSFYGFAALGSYLLGGPLADKYPPRKLMGVALIMTSLGGLVYANEPSLMMLNLLYAYWGFTTIFLFWAAMIKATRIWGGLDNQGKAFGFLDGGRGLVGALFGLLGVYIYAIFASASEVALTLEEQREAFKYIVYTSSILVAIIGIIVFFFLRVNDENTQETKKKITKSDIESVLKIRAVWLLMIIILCAYVGYKMTGLFAQYAEEVMHYSKLDAAKTGTFLLFIRPVVGVVIGFLADRSRPSLYLCIGFILSIIGAGLFASGLVTEGHTILFFLSIVITAVGIYAARVLYFAVMEEGNIPLALTGTAVGVISFIGYTPDIFTALMTGYFLDDMPGITGFQVVFGLLALFSSVGFLAAMALYRSVHKKVIIS